MKNEKMEIFKNNLESRGFSLEFIKKSIEYFRELEEEMEIQEKNNIKDILDYYNNCGSYTCDTLQSENNLKELREDIALLKNEYTELLDLNLYFKNIERFEIQILYILLFEFYPNEEKENL